MCAPTRASSGRRPPPRAATGARPRPEPALAGAGAPAAPPWRPPAPGRRPRVATETYDEWDDDLDWGGETAVADAPPAAPAAPLPESDLDWQVPGERNGGAVAEPAEEPMWDDWADAEEPANGNGNGVVAPPVNGNGVSATRDGTARRPRWRTAGRPVDTPGRATPHDDARTDAPGAEPSRAADGARLGLGARRLARRRRPPPPRAAPRPRASAPQRRAQGQPARARGALRALRHRA